MKDLQSATGSCLCGAVKFNSSTVSQSVGACHCGMCRKWGGGPLMSVDCGSEVSFENEEHITRYDSSEWAERGFCKKCGSHLFYYLKPNKQFIMPLGLLDDLKNVSFDHQIYIDHKPAHYAFANDTKNMTEAEVIAMFDNG